MTGRERRTARYTPNALVIREGSAVTVVRAGGEALLAPRGGARWGCTVCIGLAALEIIPSVPAALVDVELRRLRCTGKAIVGASYALR